MSKTPRNWSKESVQARKTLRKLHDIHELVSEAAVEAVETMITVMRDTTQPGATRKAAAKDVLDLYMKFAAHAKDQIPEGGNREVEKDTAYAPVAVFSVQPQSK